MSSRNPPNPPPGIIYSSKGSEIQYVLSPASYRNCKSASASGNFVRKRVSIIVPARGELAPGHLIGETLPVDNPRSSSSRFRFFDEVASTLIYSRFSRYNLRQSQTQTVGTGSSRVSIRLVRRYVRRTAER